jgi:hypothetical protein
MRPVYAEGDRIPGRAPPASGHDGARANRAALCRPPSGHHAHPEAMRATITAPPPNARTEGENDDTPRDTERLNDRAYTWRGCVTRFPRTISPHRAAAARAAVAPSDRPVVVTAVSTRAL